MVINYIVWAYSLRQILEYISCFTTYKQIVSFVTFLLEQMS